MSWDPAVYLDFANERTQPAVDLLAHVPNRAPRLVVDLGCGPGNSTALLAARWPQAQLMGLDGDAAMLERARRTHPAVTWVQGDIAQWQPETPPEVIVSNAALHWLDNHAAVLPRLLSLLPDGGTLAVQMPANFTEPSHVLMRAVARSGPWAAALAPHLRDAPVAGLQDYYHWLNDHCSRLELWETTYLMRLTGADPVLAWVRGTALRPLLRALDEKTAATFEAAYADRLRRAYPRQANGVTLFPFRRLFIVAGR